MKKLKLSKVKHNFLALNIPTIVTTTSENGQSVDKPMGFDIEIYGDEGYHYKGTITSYQGIIPNFMVPIKGDKKLFVNINYKFSDSSNNSLSKKFVNFIEVPKRFQIVDENDSHMTGKKDTVNEDSELEHEV